MEPFPVSGHNLYLRIMAEIDDRVSLINGPDTVVVTHHVSPVEHFLSLCYIFKYKGVEGSGKVDMK